MVKKYLIRIIGALCILGSLALMFMPGWFQLKGISRRELRNLRADVNGICTGATDEFVYLIEEDDDFKDQLKDDDLPYTRGKIKSRFGEIANVAEELLDDTVSLKELLVLSWKAPGMLKDAQRLLDSDCSEVFFDATANYIMQQGIGATEKQVEEAVEDGVDWISEYSFVFVLLAGVLILILALAVASAATHVCNKVRWLKYVFLLVLVLMVVGTCVALPLVSNMLSDSLEDAKVIWLGRRLDVEDMALRVKIMPFVSVALMIVPIVLDIIFERKKTKKLVEE